MRPSFLFASAILFAAPTAAAPAGGPPRTVFQCLFGKKQVVVSQAGPLYLYSFGMPGRPEVQIVGDRKRGNVFASGSFGTLDGYQNLRIANGRYSYVVFFEGLSERYGTKGATSSSGLAVFDGTKQISKFSCKSGIGFKYGWNDKQSPPEDPVDYEIS